MKDFCLNTFCSFELYTLKNNIEAANQHIRMISEGSCDTEEISASPSEK